jgi:hypothetical protein
MGTSILVFFGDVPIGAIQSFTLKSKVTVAAEDGYQFHSHQLDGTRMRLVKDRLGDLFGNLRYIVASQAYPVQIVVSEDGKIVQQIHNVWLSGIDHSYTSGDWIIIENFASEAERVTPDYGLVVKSDDEHEDVANEQMPD